MDSGARSYRLAIGASRGPLADRKNDLYETPPEAIRALIKAESLPPRIWEPACGPGAIVRELRDAGHTVYATDLVNYFDSPDQDQSRVDFLIQGPPEQIAAQFRPDAIVTNPPFKNATAFVERALGLAPRVYMLLRLTFLESRARSQILDHGRLRRVYVFSRRLPMMHRAGWEGPKSTSSMAFAWFVWHQTPEPGPIELRRIDWERK